MSATIEIGPVIAALSRIAADNHSTWLASVGERGKQSIQERIRSTKIDPDGHGWAPWRESTSRKRAAKGNASQGLLWDSGHLLESQTFVTPLSVGVEIGTDIGYAPYLQDGTRHMVARPFVGWSEKDVSWLESSFVAHLAALIG